MGPWYPLAENRGEWGSLDRGSAGSYKLECVGQPPIKYAGLRGKEVRVIGKNRSSLGEDGTIQ